MTTVVESGKGAFSNVILLKSVRCSEEKIEAKTMICGEIFKGKVFSSIIKANVIGFKVCRLKILMKVTMVSARSDFCLSQKQVPWMALC